MTPASGIVFPFLRETHYLLGELKAFEADLHEKRLNNPALSNELRARITGSPGWIALRKKELIPLIYYGNLKGISDSVRFLITRLGHQADIQLNHPDKTENLQMTTAYPEWPFKDAREKKGGRRKLHTGGDRHRYEMEILNRMGEVGLGELQEQNDAFFQRRRMVSNAELEEAHFNGLSKALKSKFSKRYSEDLVLVVHAVGYESLSDERFHTIAHRARSELKTLSDISPDGCRSGIGRLSILDRERLVEFVL
ncbi:hypothetical protein [Methylocystis sp.]|uniref:hypothetical protein n=1 Tax=Methylocystis sp. TaxID=1911079 RepID=UPI003DA4F62E